MPPANGAPGFQEIAPISRAIALEEWELAFTLMGELVGHELAGEWLVIELELAGWRFEARDEPNSRGPYRRRG